VKLGEALTLRSQLQTRFVQLRDRLASSVFAQEGEAPPEDPAALLTELEQVAAQLEDLIARINKTNLATTIDDGRTVTDALARRDHLTILHAAFQKVAGAASESQVRYGKAGRAQRGSNPPPSQGSAQHRAHVTGHRERRITTRRARYPVRAGTGIPASR
jgi:hypothetical protein